MFEFLEIEKITFCLFALGFVFGAIEYFYCCYEIHKLDKEVLTKKVELLEKIYLSQMYKDYE